MGKNLETIFKENQIIKGQITNKVKGGFSVNIENIKSFLPKSLSDFRIIKNLKENENEIFEFKIIKMDKKRNNIVISRKAVVQNNIWNNKKHNRLRSIYRFRWVRWSLTHNRHFV